MPASRFRFLLTAALALAPAAAGAGELFVARLDGATMIPPSNSPATGTFTALYSPAGLLQLWIDFSGLESPAFSAHLHCCIDQPANVGVAINFTFSGFPVGVTAGSFQFTYDLTAAATYPGSFVANNGGTAAGAHAALYAGLTSRRSYVDVHTTVGLVGEIRGIPAWLFFSDGFEGGDSSQWDDTVP